MTLTKIRNYSVTTMLLCFAAAGQAKNMNHAPDVTSGDYWDKHDIGVFRLIAVGSDADHIEYSTFELESLISEGPVQTPRTVPFSHLWFGSDSKSSSHIKVSDRFLL